MKASQVNVYTFTTVIRKIKMPCSIILNISSIHSYLRQDYFRTHLYEILLQAIQMTRLHRGSQVSSKASIIHVQIANKIGRNNRSIYTSHINHLLELHLYHPENYSTSKSYLQLFKLYPSVKGKRVLFIIKQGWHFFVIYTHIWTYLALYGYIQEPFNRLSVHASYECFDYGFLPFIYL